MIASTMTVGCGLTLCIAFWADESSAKPPPPPRQVLSQTYEFDGFVVTVTPGVDPSAAGLLSGRGTVPAIIPAETTPQKLVTGIEVIPATFLQSDATSPAILTTAAADDQAASDLPPLPLEDVPEPPTPATIASPDAALSADSAPKPASDSGAEKVLPCSLGHATAEDRARQYREIYNSIPFSRTEYDANPSYRHEAAMEILFGQLRPTVIHRNTTNVEVSLPDYSMSPWAYNSYGMNSFYYPFYTSYGPYPFPHGRGGRIHRGW